ncbi:aconitase family protein, partial [Aeromonas hydrophila]|uniref:aconitase family protein n=1 Tax=Aeromonas hydrophila TaxID=644 RepID=UPI0020C7F26E
ASAGVQDDLNELGFNLVGYGCTTCIGNSGPLPDPVEAAINERDLTVASVLSGNRNFEGRVHPNVRTNWLASPPLVVAYALAGTVRTDLSKEPLGKDNVEQVRTEMYRKEYAEVFDGDETWQAIEVPEAEVYEWKDSTYIQHPPFFEGMEREPKAVQDVENARVLAMLGDSVTTDHISPAGAIKPDSPAGRYLKENG